MDCEGIVTGINSDYLYFELDNTVRVHMSILLSQNRSQKMPTLGSKIMIEKAHRQGSVYVACNHAKLNGNFSADYKKNMFLRLVKKFKFGTEDLYKVDKIVNTIDQNFTGWDELIKAEIIIPVLRNISYSSSNTAHSDDICENRCISSYDIITVSSCRYVEIQSRKFSKYPYWSFGVHSSPKNTFLFGCLEIQPIYGILLLKDWHYHLPCLIYNASSEKISRIVEKNILIEKYRVITEIYNQNGVPNIEYLLVDFEDINIIYQNKSSMSLFGEIVPSDRTFLKNMHFQIIRKSMVRVGDTNEPECWFQVLIKNENSCSEEAFLILPSNYIGINIYFEEGLHYSLFYNTPLKKTSNIELTRVKKLETYKLEENDGFFVKANDANKYTETILSVQECKNYLVDNTDLVSFQGFLKFKKFAEPLSSRTTKRTSVYGFGTPGPKVHKLTFQDNQSQNIIYLDCYLNNWENVLMPLGLIPHMWVIVRHVLPQSKKYVKSSVFTTFEIKLYDPPVNFETVNLYENDRLNWGRPFYLGHGNHIPTGILIWARICNIHILKVALNRRCLRCRLIQESGRCGRCRINESDFDFFAEMHVSDEFGQSRVMAKFPGFMKTLLDLQEHQYQSWLMAFKALGQYEYNFFEQKEITGRTPERVRFKETITDFFELINKQGILHLDLKCRKLDSNPQKYGGRPLWLCVDVRRS